MVKIADQVSSFDAVYSECLAAATLHTQAGFSDQQGVTPVSASRLATSLQISTTFMALACANSGVSDIFPAEPNR